MSLTPEPHLAEQAGGFVLALRVAPGASRERLVGVHGTALKIAVQAPPERGKANARVLAVLAHALHISTRDVTLLSGDTSRDKRVLIAGLTRSELLARIASALGSARADGPRPDR